jgi:hypothetical protein
MKSLFARPGTLSILFVLMLGVVSTARTVRAFEVVAPELATLDPITFPTTASSPFGIDKRWSFELLANGMGDVTNRHVQMGGMTAGFGYYFFNNVAIQMDLTGYGFSEGRSSGAAVGFTLGIRHHLFDIGNNSFFIDVAGGELEASNNLPYRGTHLNNTIQFGFGVAHPIAENLYLLAGARYYHISNAEAEGQDRNPSVNAIQGVIGLMWRF